MSGGEILIILFVFLLLFGPEKIPAIARTLGKIMREVQNATDSIKDEISKETEDFKKDAEEIKKEFSTKDTSKENDKTTN